MVYAVSSPSNRSSGPEIPPDVPPEYADAYLAGFQRGLSGLEPDSTAEQPVQEAPVPEGLDKLHRPEELDRPGDDEPGEPVSVQRGATDLEWLFDRRESGPPGWTVGADHGSEEESSAEPDAEATPAAASTGATSVAGSGPRSPWPMVGAFVVVLLLLMLLAYLGGMAFSTIMNR